jgi:hypothetical protein
LAEFTKPRYTSSKDKANSEYVLMMRLLAVCSTAQFHLDAFPTISCILFKF